MLLTPEGTVVDGDNLRNRIFYRLLEKAEVRQVTLHDLRHTYASPLIQQGESMAYVQKQLGHSSIQVTGDIYEHLIPGANLRQWISWTPRQFASQTPPRTIKRLVARAGSDRF